MHLPGINNVVNIKDTTALGIRTFYAEDSQRILHTWWEAQWESLSSPFFQQWPSSHSALCFWPSKLLTRSFHDKLGTQAPHRKHMLRNQGMWGGEEWGWSAPGNKLRFQAEEPETDLLPPPLVSIVHQASIPSQFCAQAKPATSGDHILANIITLLPSLCIHSYLLKAATILSFNLALSFYPFGCREIAFYSKDTYFPVAFQKPGLRARTGTAKSLVAVEWHYPTSSLVNANLGKNRHP